MDDLVADRVEPVAGSLPGIDLDQIAELAIKDPDLPSPYGRLHSSRLNWSLIFCTIIA